MVFSEMPYKRPDPEKVTAEIKEATEKLKNAGSYEEARAVFLETEERSKAVETAATLAYIRQSIDTRDEFYSKEKEFWDNFGPEIEEYKQAWLEAMLQSPFRKDFEKEYGDLLFVNAEIQRKTFSPEIISDMQKENELVREYDDLIASAQIPFEDGVYTLSDPRAVILKEYAGAMAKGTEYEKEFRLLESIERLTPLVFEEIKHSGKVMCANIDMYSLFFTRTIIEHEYVYCRLARNVERNCGRPKSARTGGIVFRLPVRPPLMIMGNWSP